MKHEKCIFVPDVSSRAFALKPGFDNAERKSGCSKNNWTPKFSDYLQIEKRRRKNKVAVAVELSIDILTCMNLSK